jgi:hypothetical protein
MQFAASFSILGKSKINYVTFWQRVFSNFFSIRLIRKELIGFWNQYYFLFLHRCDDFVQVNVVILDFVNAFAPKTTGSWWKSIKSFWTLDLFSNFQALFLSFWIVMVNVFLQRQRYAIDSYFSFLQVLNIKMTRSESLFRLTKHTSYLCFINSKVNSYFNYKISNNSYFGPLIYCLCRNQYLYFVVV